MRPLTDTVPKPLVTLRGKPLILWQLEALARAGFRDIVINTAWLGDKIEEALGDGRQFGVGIRYSREGARAEDALETRGGIVHALGLLGEAPFATVSSDIFTDYQYANLLPVLDSIARGAQDAHFVLADNPAFNAEGDFAIQNGLATRNGTAANPRLNYAGITCWHPKLFHGLPVEKSRLFPWADTFVAANRIGASYHGGMWENIGTLAHLERLAQMQQAETMNSIK
jgi:N-acetyl-alpha-D-muramate 1-phosphate uridylyltransferase